MINITGSSLDTTSGQTTINLYKVNIPSRDYAGRVSMLRETHITCIHGEYYSHTILQGHFQSMAINKDLKEARVAG